MREDWCDAPGVEAIEAAADRAAKVGHDGPLRRVLGLDGDE